MLTNGFHNVLYCGVTSDLIGRMWKHRSNYYKTGFSSRYNVYKLVYFRNFASIAEAIAEEKRIKGLTRIKKNKLIESINPTWRDLWEDVKKW